MYSLSLISAGLSETHAYYQLECEITQAPEKIHEEKESEKEFLSDVLNRQNFIKNNLDCCTQYPKLEICGGRKKLYLRLHGNAQDMFDFLSDSNFSEKVKSTISNWDDFLTQVKNYYLFSLKLDTVYMLENKHPVLIRKFSCEVSRKDMNMNDAVRSLGYMLDTVQQLVIV